MDVVVGLGANLGDRRATLASAVRALSTVGGVVAVSSLYETLAVGAPGPDFLNAAVRLDVTAEPVALLLSLLEVERAHGRERRERFGPRTLDLDVLWIRGRVVAESGLEVPHARLLERRFALAPLLEVAPDASDPRTGRALAAHLSALPESGVAVLAGSGWVQAFPAATLSG